MIQVMLTEPHAASKILLKIKLFDPVTWHASYYVSFEHKMSYFIWNLPEPYCEYQTKLYFSEYSQGLSDKARLLSSNIIH